ncbi:unnamed protein product, partial [Mesorhabditis spiculigera]
MSADGGLRPTLFVRLLNKVFKHWAPFLVKHDVAILIATLIFTLVTSIKIPFTKQQDDVRTGWSPDGARSVSEMHQYSRYLGNRASDPIAAMVFIEARDHGNMLRHEHLKHTIQLLDDLSAAVSHKNRTYNDLCGSMCAINDPFRLFYNSFEMRELRENDDGETAGIAFPTMSILGKEIDLSPHLFGVKLDENHELAFVRVVQLNLNTGKPDDWTRDDVMQFERALYNYIHTTFKSEVITPRCLSLTFATDEIVRTGEAIFPFIGVGFLIMATFAVVTVWWGSRKLGQWSFSRAQLAVLGCVCPLLATSSALGLLFWMGFRFGTILAVTPFLVLAIGVDDAFLQLQSWARLRDESPHLSREERMRLMLEDIGPSISITSLTNFFAFLVGYFTPTPEIQLFCIGNAVAIIFDYLYQISMFCCMISIGARREEGQPRKIAPAPGKLIIPIAHKKHEELEEAPFITAYSKWISSPFTTALLFSGLLVYWFITARGALQMSVILSSKSLVIEGSPLIDIENLREQYILPNYTNVVVLVNGVGDFADPARQGLCEDLIKTFESFPEAIGPETTHFWLRDYRAFQEITEEEAEVTEDGVAVTTADPFTRKSLKQFLEWPEFRHWAGFIQFDDMGKLDRFMATVSFHGETLGRFAVRKEMLERWRAVVDRFPQLNASIFDDFASFVDQTDSMVPATLSSSAVTLATMLVACFFFMNSLFTIVIAALSIISICLGVFGFLALWNVNLDPISMSCLIMSIGFSVDFPAHISFHFHREGLEHPETTPAERVARSLLAIGFPLLQCGVSTVLFVLCLICIKTYMGEVFVKTVFLVVSLGLLHGLVIVPSFLCSLSNLHTLFLEWRQKKRVTKPVGSSSPSASSISISPASSEVRFETETRVR